MRLALVVLAISCTPKKPVLPVVRNDTPAACLDSWQPLRLSGAGAVYVEVHVGVSGGAFLLDWGTTRSTIDPRAFTSGIEPVPVPGTTDQFDDVDFFGPQGRVRLLVQDHSGIDSPVPQAGILGTDVLGKHLYAVDWNALRVYRASEAVPCDDAVWRGLGLRPLDSSGYFAKDVSALHAPNVPTVPIRIAGATAPAQLDTGFDDRVVSHSVNVNQPYFALLEEATTLERREDLDLDLTTCVPGADEHVAAWIPDEPLELVGADGEAVRHVEDVVLFVHDMPPEAKICGGVGTWNRPAAQLGASILSEGKLAIFDPITSRVWLEAEP